MKSSTLQITIAITAITFSTISITHADPPTITAIAKAATAPNKKKVETTAADQSVQPAVARSEFVLPRKTADGRDPFYPNSARPYGVETATTVSTETPVAEVEFVLKGISGTTDKPLAIINNTTFATGEENEVIFNSKRVKIRCFEINMANSTVLIDYAGIRRQLKLNKAH